MPHGQGWGLRSVNSEANAQTHRRHHVSHTIVLSSLILPFNGHHGLCLWDLFKGVNTIIYEPQALRAASKNMKVTFSHVVQIEFFSKPVSPFFVGYPFMLLSYNSLDLAFLAKVCKYSESHILSARWFMPTVPHRKKGRNWHKILSFIGCYVRLRGI